MRISSVLAAVSVALVSTQAAAEGAACQTNILGGQSVLRDAQTGAVIYQLPAATEKTYNNSGYTFSLSGGSVGGGTYTPAPVVYEPPVSGGSDAISDILNGTNWTITQVFGQEIAVGSTLNFGADGSYGGNAPCNTYGGDVFPTVGFAIDFNPPFSTRRACARLDDEQSYFQALQASTSFRLGREGDTLALLDQSGVTVVMAVRPGANPFPQPGVILGAWQVRSAVGELPPGGAQNESASVTFNSDGSFSASLGCNDASGQYSVSGANLTFGTVAVTARACLVAAKFESALLRAFPNVRTYQIELDGTVSFRDAGGAILFTVAR